jgi:hypothetical protein
MLKILLLILSFLFMLLMNGLANGLPLNGKTTGQLSALYPNLFVPAGFTFSIWGLIYTLLLAYVLYTIYLFFKGKKFEISYLVICNFLLNGLWIVFWHYELVFVSLVIMISLLAVLVLYNLELKNKNKVLLEKLAFGVYLGWICVAIVANTTAWLVKIDWFKWGILDENWTSILIVVASLIGVFLVFKAKNPSITFSILWAFYGIYSKRSLAEIQYPQIYFSLIVGSTVIVFCLIYYFFKNIFRLFNTSKSSIQS